MIYALREFSTNHRDLHYVITASLGFHFMIWMTMLLKLSVSFSMGRYAMTLINLKPFFSIQFLTNILASVILTVTLILI